jgi:hypothetical protein
MKPLALTVVFLVACGGPDSGTAVGNPGAGLTVRLAPPPGFSLDAGTVPDATVTLEPCLGTPDPIATTTFDLTDPVPVNVPAGSWCGVSLEPTGDITASFSGQQPADLRLAVDVITTVTGLPFEPADGLYVLLLGGPEWPAREDLVGDIAPGSAEHDRLVASLKADSIVFFDGDADGRFGTSDQVVSASTPGDFDLPEPEDDEDTDEDDDDDTDD